MSYRKGLLMERSSDNNYVVQMNGIIKTFPGVRALDDVEFTLKPGELLALVGKNGAGKSTLMNVLAGIYAPDSGEIWVGDEQIDRMTTARAREVGIAFVHQHSQLIPNLSIAESMYAGRLPTNKLGLVDWSKLYQEADERLHRVGLEIDVKRKVEGLTVAEKQVIEIAKALFADARVIILDEATAPLPKNEVDLLFDFVRRQTEEGVAFIYISHFLEEVFELCHSVTVLRDGKLIGNYQSCDIDQNELVRLIGGGKTASFEREKREVEEKILLEIKNLTRPGCYDDLNFAIKRGEIVGLTGLEGCGKASLARGLFGLEELGAGEVVLDGEPLTPSDTREALNRGVAYLPRDRHGLGILGIRSIRENVALPILRRLSGAAWLLKLKEEIDIVNTYVEKLGVVTPSIDQNVENLSGGNQQKVVFAKLVGTKPKVLLLDEPTQGVDVLAKVEILKIIEEMAQQGVASVFVSEEIREMLDICDRIFVMYKHKVVAEFIVGEPTTTVENILLAVEGSTSNNGL
jgi:ribose transport system ATP-binding protein